MSRETRRDSFSQWQRDRQIRAREQLNQRARERQRPSTPSDEELPPEFRPEFRLIQWEMSPAEMRDFYEQASEDTRRRLEADNDVSLREAMQSLRREMSDMRSETPRVFGQEIVDGYYIVKSAPESEAVGAVVRIKDARVQNQRQLYVATLLSRGFVLERVHVLDDTEYRQLLKEDGHLPFYEDLPDLPDNQELRHCAHCGRPACLGKVFEGSRMAHKGFKWYVRCIGCGGGNEGFIKKEDAVAWWNHRDQRVVNPPLVIIGKKAEIKLGGNRAD